MRGPDPDVSADSPDPPFATILCAVDGSRGSAEAARQATVLARPGAALHFIAVTHVTGTGLVEMADLGEDRAEEALQQSVRLAAETGVVASAERKQGTPTHDILLAAADAHELLVLGSHGGSRAEGIMFGSTASQLAHRTVKPLLVARSARDGGDFPSRILVATDGSPGSWAATRAAARIAQVHGSAVGLVHGARGADHERRRTVGEQAEAIRDATAVEPVVTDSFGAPADAIVEAARSHRASLLVIGHRGLHGVRALGSVSERVVHQAPCSVLVVPPDGR